MKNVGFRSIREEIVVVGSTVCPACGSKSTEIYGRGEIIRGHGRPKAPFKCKACGHKFHVNSRNRNGN